MSGNKQEKTQKLIFRILALLLAIVMLGGSAYYLIATIFGIM